MPRRLIEIRAQRWLEARLYRVIQCQAGSRALQFHARKVLQFQNPPPAVSVRPTSDGCRRNLDAAKDPGELASTRVWHRFLECDADFQGTALRLFLRAVESCLRAHGRRAGKVARLGAAAFIHRFGSARNTHMHFHSWSSTALAPSPLRRTVWHSMPPPGSMPLQSLRCSNAHPGTCCASSRAAARCKAMMRGRWAKGNTAAAFPSMPRCASRPPTAPVVSGCCVIAHGRHSPWTRCASKAHHLRPSKKPLLGGSGPQLLTPLELLDRVAALIPPPRVHCHRHFGALRQRPLTGIFRGDPERQDVAGRAPPRVARLDPKRTFSPADWRRGTSSFVPTRASRPPRRSAAWCRCGSRDSHSRT